MPMSSDKSPRSPGPPSRHGQVSAGLAGALSKRRPPPATHAAPAFCRLYFPRPVPLSRSGWVASTFVFAFRDAIQATTRKGVPS